ncbi:MAG: aminotransferase class IV [Tidjanibacter sp.]|nr:aminotransferase class IV [Tidjanibacter sp.]
MNVGKIYMDDKIVPVKDLSFYATRFLHANYLYQTINTVDHRPLYLKEHLANLAAAHEALYGKPLELEEKKIERQITNLLHEGRLPHGGNSVNIIVIPDNDEPHIIIEHNRMTLYEGFAILSLRPKAIITNYEIPFERHLTSVSMQTADFMNSVAKRNGLHLAIRANRKGQLISAGDYPLFAVKNRTVMTVPVAEGAKVCAEREMMFRLCQMAGINIEECDIPVSELKNIDELMIFTPIGIQSVLCCDNKYFHSTVASLLDRHLPRLTKEGFSSFKRP